MAAEKKKTNFVLTFWMCKTKRACTFGKIYTDERPENIHNNVLYKHRYADLYVFPTFLAAILDLVLEGHHRKRDTLIFLLMIYDNMDLDQTICIITLV